MEVSSMVDCAGRTPKPIREHSYRPTFLLSRVNRHVRLGPESSLNPWSKVHDALFFNRAVTFNDSNRWRRGWLYLDGKTESLKKKYPS
jgi:hypothetical protein